MADQRHSAAFIVGAVLGGLAGAAITLWNTPQAGARTRDQLATGTQSTLNRFEGARHQASSQAIGLAERAAAPIVGLRLGERESGQVGSPHDTDQFAAVAAPPSPAAEQIASPTDEVSSAHVATTEELTTPQVPVRTGTEVDPEADFTEFPDFTDRNRGQ